jgi:methyl-accepting chemotaxis protein
MSIRNTHPMILIGLCAALLIVLAALRAWPFALAAAGLAALVITAFPQITPLPGAMTCVGALLFGTLISGGGATDSMSLGLLLIAAAAGLRALSLTASPQATPVMQSIAPESPTGNGLTLRLQHTADGMVKSARAVDEVLNQQTDGAREQIELITTTNDRLDTFIHLAKNALENIRTLTRSAQFATDISRDGQEALGQAISGMQQIRSQVTQIGETTVRLAQLTERIDRIITSVSEIATQSNLLALNASIEAARAGVHGRGFAVVAEEVRVLARQSTEAAQQVRAILGEIQGAVRETVDATQAGMALAERGADVTQEANRIMSQLDASVSAAYEAVKGMASMIRDQSDGMEEIAISMERVNLIAQQNLAGTRVVEQVARSLSGLASELEAGVERV